MNIILNNIINIFLRKNDKIKPEENKNSICVIRRIINSTNNLQNIIMDSQKYLDNNASNKLELSNNFEFSNKFEFSNNLGISNNISVTNKFKISSKDNVEILVGDEDQSKIDNSQSTKNSVVSFVGTQNTRLKNEYDTKNKLINNFNIFLKCFIHELRTPLSTISMGINLLENQIPNNEKQNIIGDLNKNIVFIENIFTKFALIKNGNIQLNKFENFNIETVIKTTYNILQYNIKKKKIIFEYNIEKNINQIIYGDEHNINHVFINLVKNAINYSVGGLEERSGSYSPNRVNKISIDVSSIGTNLIINICDTNNHILPHIKKNLFQLLNSTSGSGLGLYICKNIIELHNGTITHDCLDNIGNKFTITLVSGVTKDTTLKHNGFEKMNYLQYSQKIIKSIKENLSFENLLSVKNNKYDIMIGDDSSMTLKMMFQILKASDNINNIHVANNGAEIISKLIENMNLINILLIDKNMPVLDGNKTVRILRRFDCDKLIFGVTGSDDINDINQFMEDGVDYVFIKPLNKAKLIIFFNFLNKYGDKRIKNKVIKEIKQNLFWLDK